MNTKTTALRAFHGSQEVKDKYVARVQAHMLADQIVQGEGWNQYESKGCCVGCTLERYDHAQYEVELGIPQTIARLFDAIHEGLPKGEFQKWPLLSLECIPVGADLNNVWSRFAGWVISTEVRQWVGEEYKDVHAALDQVTALYARLAAGETVTEQEWRNAARAAADAAYPAYEADAATYAARAAADAADAATYAARAAARAAADAAYPAYEADAATYAADAAYAARAAAYAARAAAYAAGAAAYAAAAYPAAGAAYAAARAASWMRMRDKLVELLSAAPVLEVA